MTARRNVPPTLAQRIGREFVRELMARLGPDTLAVIIERNRHEPNPNVCHSHDFCDANVYMARAFEIVRHGQRLRTPMSTRNTELWNEAWQHAGLRPQGYGDERVVRRVPLEPLMCPICGEHPVQATHKIDAIILSDGSVETAATGGTFALYCANDCDLGEDEIPDGVAPSRQRILGMVRAATPKKGGR